MAFGGSWTHLCWFLTVFSDYRFSMPSALGTLGILSSSVPLITRISECSDSRTKRIEFTKEQMTAVRD